MTTVKTLWQIDVQPKLKQHDSRGRSMLAEIHRAGFHEITGLAATRLYQLDGTLTEDDVTLLAQGLFTDAVIESHNCRNTPAWPDSSNVIIEVHLQPGVMDPVAMSSRDAAQALLIANSRTAQVNAVRTAWRYEIEGVDSLERLQQIAEGVLANTCMETVFINGLGKEDELPNTLPEPPAAVFERRTVSLTGLSDEELEQLSRRAHLFLSAAEMKAIRDHFETLGRDPSDLELETLAQTWSEHCVHKTLKSSVKYTGSGFGNDTGNTVEKSYDNLLKDTVAKATNDLNKPWCWSVFVDNAGIVEFDEEWGIAFKVETHNHPSAIEPYGGAATGAGGCIRDILGCGLGAKPIANTDIFCVADPDYDTKRLPRGILHPRRILRGIVSGVRDYGNRMGIPTVAGGLYFDQRYLGNPLVFCGCIGIIPRNRIDKEPQPGDKIVVAGGRTGRDGLGGATFSSAELTDTHADEFAHAVQIGNAIEEKKVLDAQLRVRDHQDGCLYTAITDCGAGGLSSAVGEMAEKLGANVELQTVPLKYDGLRYNEIWLSEAQERMVMSVPPENLDKLLAIFEEESVETAVIGTFTGNGILSIRYNDTVVGEINCDFLHNGIPKMNRVARWTAPTNTQRSQDFFEDADYATILQDRLRSLNTCSRETVFRQYDHEVQGANVIKPLVGIGEGPSDAAVIRPLLNAYRGIAIGCGLCPQTGDSDPYWMAVEAIDEAIRNVVAVGANPDRIAILDNFCWSGCKSEEEMGALVRACQGCYDAAVAYSVPFISGKDSLNNQFSLSEEDAKRLDMPTTVTIPDTLLISAIGMIDDVRNCVTSDLKKSGNKLCSVTLDIRKHGMNDAAQMHKAVADLINTGHVTACHDIGDEGLAVCIAEMCIGGLRGANINLDSFPEDTHTLDVLFGGTQTGYLLELTNDADLSSIPQQANVTEIGTVADSSQLAIIRNGKTELNLEAENLAHAWRCGLSLDSKEVTGE